MARPGPSKASTSDATALPPVTRSSAHPLDRPEGPAPKSPGPTKAPERKKTSPAPTVSVAGTGAPEEPPTEEELRKTPASERRQFNIGVPKSLRLHRRAGLYAEDHGLSRQDQVAIALDAWLRERGY
jgi:hypothetical protein